MPATFLASVARHLGRCQAERDAPRPPVTQGLRARRRIRWSASKWVLATAWRQDV